MWPWVFIVADDVVGRGPIAGADSFDTWPPVMQWAYLITVGGSAVIGVTALIYVMARDMWMDWKRGA